MTAWAHFGTAGTSTPVRSGGPSAMMMMAAAAGSAATARVAAAARVVAAGLRLRPRAAEPAHEEQSHSELCQAESSQDGRGGGTTTAAVELHPHDGVWLEELGEPYVSDWPAPLLFLTLFLYYLWLRLPNLLWCGSRAIRLLPIGLNLLSALPSVHRELWDED